jgi:hypothetical protein
MIIVNLRGSVIGDNLDLTRSVEMVDLELAEGILVTSLTWLFIR